MDLVAVAHQPSSRCSPAVRELGVDPIGSAVGATSFLLIEWPGPWPRDLADDARLSGLHEAVASQRAAGRPWRVQAIDAAASTEIRRVTAYQIPDGPFHGYHRREVTASASGVVAAAIDLLRTPGQALDSDPTTDGRGDLLVCTHGRRDSCCGSLGTRLWKALVDGAPLVTSDVRVSRTSHTGGHRFAPTCIHLPTGTSWAWMDAALVGGIVRRDMDLSIALPHYRGNTSLASVEEQVVDQAVLELIGWSWLDYSRTSRVIRHDAERSTVEFSYEAPGGDQGTFRGETIVVGSAPVPDCGSPIDDSVKRQPVVAMDGALVDAERQP